MINSPYIPFHCTYSPNVPELLLDMQCSLILTTYQAGKLIIISPLDGERLIQLPRDFKKAMGLAVDGRRIAIATKNELVVLSDAKGISRNFPPQPNTYDGLFVPRACYYTGEIDIHDMHWSSRGLYAVITRFSTIALIDDQYSFTPIWKPSFISAFDSSDACHLNGMATENDKPKYVSAFGKTHTPKGWREGIMQGGIIIDLDSHETVAGNLPMPHSPRLYDGELYVLLSGTGELVHIDPSNGHKEVVTRMEGFVRGMCKWGDYLFIGLSKIRKSSSVFRDLPILNKDVNCGVDIIHLPTGLKAGHLRYENDVEELYDVQLLHKYLRPGILNHMDDVHKNVLNTPEFDFWSEPGI